MGLYHFLLSVQLSDDNYTQGRRSCNFTTNPGPNSCLDGGCNGGILIYDNQTVAQCVDLKQGLVCDPQNGTGVPPATLAEFTLQGTNSNDYYDGSFNTFSDSDIVL